ncbi:hypothetical protein J437_LFUL002871 [Ladona fulva]|uniref:Histone-lysine N-methyltransferase eggless n=1 Tax=Ladona fulva TaxID=123851 RepID=A0A8K0PCG6_LADFU|nr:hypothetical protein J437_LFUL002871 [Ladona fulva]
MLDLMIVFSLKASTKRKKRKDVSRRDTSESQSESSNMSDDEDSEEVKRQPLKFTAAEPNVTDIKKSGKSKFRSIREIYGPGEYCYIMDAKNIGNVGRYLNHSCTPNVFVQNVFVDSHDLRFPWVAFFALTYITAGTELTWDYNYDVGSVPGKVMYCYCGSSDCRGRLL